jgi:hypothetical protein
MEIDDPDRRQRFRRLVEQRVGVSEGVLDRQHVGPALEVDDRDLGPVEGVVDPPAPARHPGRPVVERSKDPLRALEEWVDLPLVPDVVAGRDDVDPGGQDRLGGRWGQAHPAGNVLAIRRDEIDPALVAEFGQEPLDGDPTRLADEVTDHQDAARARRSRRVAVRGVAQTGSADVIPVPPGIAVRHPRTIPDRRLTRRGCGEPGRRLRCRIGDVRDVPGEVAACRRSALT